MPFTYRLAWLKTLNTSKRSCTLKRSVIFVSLYSPASRPHQPGPRKASRPLMLLGHAVPGAKAMGSCGGIQVLTSADEIAASARWYASEAQRFQRLAIPDLRVQ